MNRPGRERFEQMVRRHVISLGLTLEVSEERSRNGTAYSPGEFTRREAVDAVPDLGRREGMARQVVDLMVEDGTLEVTRTTARGWRMLRLSRGPSPASARVAQPPDWRTRREESARAAAAAGDAATALRRARRDREDDAWIALYSMAQMMGGSPSWPRGVPSWKRDEYEQRERRTAMESRRSLPPDVAARLRGS